MEKHMSFEILVDGYNVIKNNAMFKYVEDKNQSEARRLLIKHLSNRYRNTTDRVTVVFDGKDSREQTSYQDHVRVIYSRYEETADTVIVRLAAEASKQGNDIILYSDDGEVKYNVQKHGGNPLTTRGLVSSLNAASSDVTMRAEFRQAMRRTYGIDPAAKILDDEESNDLPSGARKSKKSSRRYKSLRIDKRTLK
jgi:predicted RNA-binding protein with PIN domain